ncbi:MAG: hypothetical protein JXM70_23475 [Pirellulales bacterium]|nr:hypothetical protein [Pirellulales bacterium]
MVDSGRKPGLVGDQIRTDAEDIPLFIAMRSKNGNRVVGGVDRSAIDGLDDIGSMDV